MWFLISTKVLWIMWIVANSKFGSGVLKSLIYLFCINILLNFFIYTKYMKNILSIIYYQEIYYQENKETLQKKLRYQNLSKEVKEKKQQYGHERYKNITEDEKQKLFENKKNALL